MDSTAVRTNGCWRLEIGGETMELPILAFISKKPERGAPKQVPKLVPAADGSPG